MTKRKIGRLGIKGFTLVELMATVAIIGVLAAIAIPNYVKYQRKARQAEAKVMLASLYTAESTVKNADNGHSYSSCISALGFAPEGNSYYAYGFNSATTAVAGNCGPYGKANEAADSACNVFSWKMNSSGSGIKTASCSPVVDKVFYLAVSTEGGGTAAAEVNAANLGNVLTWNSFEIVASGGIGGVLLDRWGVDQSKQVYQKQDGVQ